ncbi:MAG: ATP-binding protein [Gammaproteobacteria bacterium]|nr:ATP-binding protein [Gammaproteobacteria bacterium]
MWDLLLLYDKLSTLRELYLSKDEQSYTTIINSLRETIIENLPKESLNIIINSAAVESVVGGLAELLKNAIDAKATTIYIYLLKNPDPNRIEISVMDNGRGIFQKIQGVYDYKDALKRKSHKKADAGYLGGRNIGMVVIAKLLSKYEGELELSNRCFRGAYITLRSNLKACLDYYSTVLSSLNLGRHFSRTYTPTLYEGGQSSTLTLSTTGLARRRGLSCIGTTKGETVSLCSQRSESSDSMVKQPCLHGHRIPPIMGVHIKKEPDDNQEKTECENSPFIRKTRFHWERIRENLTIDLASSDNSISLQNETYELEDEPSQEASEELVHTGRNLVGG